MGLDAVREGNWGGPHGGCLWQVLLLHRGALGGSGGFGDRACVTHPLQPPDTTRARVKIVPAMVCLPTRPPTVGLGVVFLSGVVSL